MKKNLLLSISIILSAIIIGAGIYCAQKLKHQTIESKQGVKIEQNIKIIDDKLFFLNKECLEMKDDLSEKLSKKNSSYGDLSLEQLFYSPLKNSCLYVEYSREGAFYNKRLMDIMKDGDSAEALVMCTAGYVSFELASYYEDDQDAYHKIIAGCNNFEDEISKYK